MNCPACGSSNVQIQVLNEQKLKTAHHGIIWWICIGWWWIPTKWLVFTIPALFVKLFGLGHKKQKIINKTTTKHVCQNCGNIW